MTSPCARVFLHSAYSFALKYSVALLPWDRRETWKDYDMLISGTNASSFVVHWEEHIAQTRLIFDLGVPRNVDPKLAKHPHTVLINMDQLGHMLERRQKRDDAGIRMIESVLQEKVRIYVALFHKGEFCARCDSATVPCVWLATSGH